MVASASLHTRFICTKNSVSKTFEDLYKRESNINMHPIIGFLIIMERRITSNTLHAED